ncbi:metal-dependent hydrolase [uncultured Alistipes sp.]|jgi:hypothetical protein|uniref:metal-dependent hydrolase n=1 Tax=uncultured Alistipes sp. TaxID=538949 RepID=UPI0025EFA839|nr:metal-dependent hydrolase [uncultured Alistipes sp.]
MDILTHTLSGLAVGTVVAGFSKKGVVGKTAIITAAGIGGALPDVDAVSLWSGFDATIGRFFHLSHPGSVIYSGKFWYSHHGFFHSLFAAVLFAAVAAVIGYLISGRRSGGFRSYVTAQWAVLTGFVSGFVFHLLEDMPTPASVWGGVRFLWPSDSYIGGTGDIWWWNNYDLFLIAVGVFLIGVLLLLAKRFIRFGVKYIIATIFLLGCGLGLVQINSRDCDYAYTGHTGRYQEFEAASKKQQREILGDNLYGAMEWLDRKLPIHF